jgi:hypothetical protein
VLASFFPSLLNIVCDFSFTFFSSHTDVLSHKKEKEESKGRVILLFRASLKDGVSHTFSPKL